MGINIAQQRRLAPAPRRCGSPALLPLSLTAEEYHKLYYKAYGIGRRVAAVAVLRLRLQKPHNTVYALGSPAAAYNYRRSLYSGKKLFVVLSYAAKGLEGEIHRIQLITYQVVGQRRGYLRNLAYLPRHYGHERTLP